MPFEAESVILELHGGALASLLLHTYHTYDDEQVAFIASPGAGEPGEDVALRAIGLLKSILDAEGENYRALRRGSSLVGPGTVDVLIVPNALHRKFDLLAAVQNAVPEVE